MYVGLSVMIACNEYWPSSVFFLVKTKVVLQVIRSKLKSSIDHIYEDSYGREVNSNKFFKKIYRVCYKITFVH